MLAGRVRIQGAGSVHAGEDKYDGWRVPYYHWRLSLKSKSTHRSSFSQVSFCFNTPAVQNVISHSAKKSIRQLRFSLELPADYNCLNERLCASVLKKSAKEKELEGQKNEQQNQTYEETNKAKVNKYVRGL
jgi:hypothetical protein